MLESALSSVGASRASSRAGSTIGTNELIFSVWLDENCELFGREVCAAPSAGYQFISSNETRTGSIGEIHGALEDIAPVLVSAQDALAANVVIGQFT